MERVAQLLSAREYRQALVRLWVLASDRPELNRWEQARRADLLFESRVKEFSKDLTNEASIGKERVANAPLALIRALDTWLARTQSRGPAMQGRFDHVSLTFEEKGQRYWLVPVLQQARRQASTTHQAMYLSAWFHHHAVLPCKTKTGQHVNLQPAKGRTAKRLSALWNGQDEAPALKVWIAHFEDGAKVTWEPDLRKRGQYRTQDVAPVPTRKASVLRTVDTATGEGAHVVVFPEFSIDLAQRKALKQRLRKLADNAPILVLAGSFHEPREGPAYNTAPLLTGKGASLLTHRKLVLFGDQTLGAEFVEVGDTLHVLLTPIGCMTVLVCKDFIDVDHSLATLLSEVPVDWVLVPSFGDDKTLRAHKAKAKQLALVSVGSSVVVAQTQNTVQFPDGQPPLPGFGHIGGRNDPEPDVPVHGGMVCFPLLPTSLEPGA